jgi:hypothetical protein
MGSQVAQYGGRRGWDLLRLLQVRHGGSCHWQHVGWLFSHTARPVRSTRTAREWLAIHGYVLLVANCLQMDDYVWPRLLAEAPLHYASAQAAHQLLLAVDDVCQQAANVLCDVHACTHPLLVIRLVGKAALSIRYIVLPQFLRVAQRQIGLAHPSPQLSTGGSMLASFMELLCDVARTILLLADFPRAAVQDVRVVVSC